MKETAASEITKSRRNIVRGRQRGSKSGALCVWPLSHEPPNNTRNLLTTGVHLAWSDYSWGLELDSAAPFPLVTPDVEEHAGTYTHTGTNKQTKSIHRKRDAHPFLRGCKCSPSRPFSLPSLLSPYQKVHKERVQNGEASGSGGPVSSKGISCEPKKQHWRGEDSEWAQERTERE